MHKTCPYKRVYCARLCRYDSRSHDSPETLLCGRERKKKINKYEKTPYNSKIIKILSFFFSLSPSLYLRLFRRYRSHTNDCSASLPARGRGRTNTTPKTTTAMGMDYHYFRTSLLAIIILLFLRFFFFF